MFDIGFFELLICMAIGLLIIGPEKLPQLLRQVGIFKRKVSSNLYQFKWQLEQEVTNEDIQRLNQDNAPSKTVKAKKNKKINDQ